MPDKKPKGVIIFGVMLAIASLSRLSWIFNYSYYKVIFHQLPDALIPVRYFFTIISKMAGLICGIGILSFKEIYRKLTVWLFTLTFLTTFWRHPYFSVENSVRSIWDIQLAVKFGRLINLASLTKICFVTICFADMLFTVGVIYYLTRPKLRKHFR